ncbi:hypothetical protein PLICRDRAFT_429965 [Plicaturopsis crispa FD-325 SS-3]|uniref:Uncharacterized protein n=1 Tax=Plicaturopsis crispa FD-325 SS-3 TaxID=944288 RepID=A0A0C9SWR4_PLICR|nr:hypothetical protein PLICRDRAFT_429965 [Plicaturopsis crispa FD-325 SS-3]
MPHSLATALHDDVIKIILKHIIDTTPVTQTDGSEQTPRNPARDLLPLSLTCKALRIHCNSIIFRTLYSSHRGIAPRGLWK